MAEEWGPWVEHDGHSVPHLVGRFIEAVLEGARGGTLHAAGVVRGPNGESWLWENFGKVGWQDGRFVIWARVLRYRIRKPRAVDDLIRLAADPYVPPPVVGPEGPVRQPHEVPV